MSEEMIRNTDSITIIGLIRLLYMRIVDLKWSVEEEAVFIGSKRYLEAITHRLGVKVRKYFGQIHIQSWEFTSLFSLLNGSTFSYYKLSIHDIRLFLEIFFFSRSNQNFFGFLLVFVIIKVVLNQSNFLVIFDHRFGFSFVLLLFGTVYE